MYKLNEHGRESLNTFLDAVAKDGTARDTFFVRAEEIANQSFPVDQDAVLDIQGPDTQSGDAESVQLLKSWFDVI